MPQGKRIGMKRTTPNPDPQDNLTPACETAVAGSILMDGKRAVDAVMSVGLRPAHFTGRNCRAIFEAAVSGQPFTAATLLERAGVSVADGELIVSHAAAMPADAAAFALQVIEQHAKRELRYELARATSELGDTRQSAAFVAGNVRDRLASLAGDDVLDATITTDTLAAVMASEPPAPPCIMEDLFGPGDIFQVNAPSKARKSFLLLQLAMSVSAGIPFLDVATSARPVVLLNLEIRPEHFRLRMWRMARALGLNTAQLQPLIVLHGRGRDSAAVLREVETTAIRIGAGVVAIDPVFRLSPNGDENASTDAKGIVAALDRLAESTGAAVCYCHHTTKGAAGDRAAIDRGAGSGVLARAFDACLSLIPHKSEPGALVAEYVLRNYAPRTPFAIRWVEGRFVLATDIEATGETSASRRAATMRGPDADTLTDRALALLNGKVWPLARYKAVVASKLGLGEKRTRDLLELVRASPNVGTGKEHAFRGTWVIGPADLIESHLKRGDA